MNKNFLVFYLVIFFFAGGQIIAISSSESFSDKLQYIKLLPEGKIREYCEKCLLSTSENVGLIARGLVGALNRLIWSAVKEKEWDAMTEPERLAFKDISIIWSSNSSGNIAIFPVDWKKNDFEAVRKVIVNIVLREMPPLPPDQEHQEVAKIINKFIEFREDVEKAKKISEKKLTIVSKIKKNEEKRLLAGEIAQ